MTLAADMGMKVERPDMGSFCSYSSDLCNRQNDKGL